MLLIALIVELAALSFTWLTFGRQASRNTTPPRHLGALAAPALDHLLVLVDSHNQVTDDVIDHLQSPVDFLHQIAGPGDHFQHVRAFILVTDFVGEPAAAPVFGFLDTAAHELDDALDLRVQLRHLLVGRHR